jgi:glyoxylase-like metal-dependent hydrolase (beta-lactamase superfamily II)
MLNTSIKSEHFTFQQLAEGIYAAIATEMGAGFSNAGLIDLGNQTLIFDSFENPLAAEDLLKASIQMTGRKPSAVIISHFHADHWGGLQVFADCPTYTTEAARQTMLGLVKEMIQDKLDPSEMQKNLEESEARLAAESDLQKQRALKISIARQKYDLQTLPTLEPTIPDRTFDGKIIFHGIARSAELVATGRGHTISDCILRLPKDKIAFIGDIGFFNSQPFMAYGFPREWVALLNEMTNWKVKTFIPGHGPVGDKSDLLLEMKYIRALENMVRKVIQRGGTVKDALRGTLPPPFDAWQKAGTRFEMNVRSSYKRQKRK